MTSEAALPDPNRQASGPVRRMVARSRHEAHRVATPLELFFDLCFVVAVGQAGAQLAHALAGGHPARGIGSYALTFFVIWWAWMNFTWFASAYDTDDVPYRIATLVQITGVLILAAGVPRLFQQQDLALAVLGYVVMRLAMVAQWLRAARSETGGARTMALRYAAGIALGIIAELAVPVYAERNTQSTWHAHHIAERYGLFTLIVLGETVSAATLAIQSALDEHRALGELLPIAAGGILICFGAWWIYFAESIHGHLRSNRQAFVWGYGHYLVLGSAAAIGAGLQVAVEHAVGAAHISSTAATAAVTVPAAVYLITVWVLHSRHLKHGAAQAVLPAACVAVLACTAAGQPGVLLAGLAVAASVATGIYLHAHQA